MRILITGAIAFVIWCFFSSWLYNDILLPVMRKPVPALATPVNQTNEADSLMKLKALMPRELSIYFEFNDSKLKADPQYDNSIAAFKAWLDKYPDPCSWWRGLLILLGRPNSTSHWDSKELTLSVSILKNMASPLTR